MNETWRRTNDQEPSPELPPELLYHPLTGDSDFQYLPLEARIAELIQYARSEGFREGFSAGRTSAMNHIESRLSGAHEADHEIDYDRYCMECPNAYEIIRDMRETP